MIGQSDIHVGHVIHHRRQNAFVLSGRIRDAALTLRAFSRLIKGVQERRKKREIVAERGAGQKAVPLSQRPTQAAVHGPESLLPFLGKRFGTGNDVSEHIRASSTLLIPIIAVLC
jgi:hypothetical protein